MASKIKQVSPQDWQNKWAPIKEELIKFASGFVGTLSKKRGNTKRGPVCSQPDDKCLNKYQFLPHLKKSRTQCSTTTNDK